MDGMAAKLANPIAAKFEEVLALSEGERAWLGGVYAETRRLAARRTLVEQNAEWRETLVLKSGWAFRYTMLSDGRRQIINVIIPGDTVGVYAAIVPHVDHSIATLTELEVASISPEEMLALLRERPRLAAAMFWAAKRDEAILGEHVVRLGRRSSYERLAHVLLELAHRLRQVGLLERDPVAFACPLTQEMFADLLGLSTVHMNRTFQRMRSEGLLQFRDGRMSLLDPRGLERVAGYNGDYLAQSLVPPEELDAARP